MFLRRKNLDIRRRIVQTVSIPMMDMLVGAEFATENLLSNEAVLKHPTTRGLDTPVGNARTVFASPDGDRTYGYFWHKESI